MEYNGLKEYAPMISQNQLDSIINSLSGMPKEVAASLMASGEIISGII